MLELRSRYLAFFIYTISQPWSTKCIQRSILCYSDLKIRNKTWLPQQKKKNTTIKSRNIKNSLDLILKIQTQQGTSDPWLKVVCLITLAVSFSYTTRNTCSLFLFNLPSPKTFLGPPLLSATSILWPAWDSFSNDQIIFFLLIFFSFWFALYPINSFIFVNSIVSSF